VIRDSRPEIVRLASDFLLPRVPVRPERWVVTLRMLDPSASRSSGTAAHSQLRLYGDGAQRQVRAPRSRMRMRSRGSIPERTRTPSPAGTPCQRRRYWGRPPGRPGRVARQARAHRHPGSQSWNPL